MVKNKKLLVSFLVVLLLLVSSVSASATTIYTRDLWKTTANVNLRSGPGTGYSIIFTIPSGSALWLLDSQVYNGFIQYRAWNPNINDWSTGYVSTSYTDNVNKGTNVTGGQKYVYTWSTSSNFYVDSGYRIQNNTIIYELDPNWNYLTIDCSDNYPDYTSFNKYLYNSTWYNAPIADNSWIYGHYRVSNPSYYDLLLEAINGA